jgi:hypothetical protein
MDEKMKIQYSVLGFGLLFVVASCLVRDPRTGLLVPIMEEQQSPPPPPPPRRQPQPAPIATGYQPPPAATTAVVVEEADEDFEADEVEGFRKKITAVQTTQWSSNILNACEALDSSLAPRTYQSNGDLSDGKIKTIAKADKCKKLKLRGMQVIIFCCPDDSALSDHYKCLREEQSTRDYKDVRAFLACNEAGKSSTPNGVAANIEAKSLFPKALSDYRGLLQQVSQAFAGVTEIHEDDYQLRNTLVQLTGNTAEVYNGLQKLIGDLRPADEPTKAKLATMSTGLQGEVKTMLELKAALMNLQGALSAGAWKPIQARVQKSVSLANGYVNDLGQPTMQYN